MSDDEIILSGSEETLKPIISLLIGIKGLLQTTPTRNSCSDKSSVRRKDKPQIRLYFREEGVSLHNALEGEINFRVMDVEATTITQQQVNAVSRIIKQKFATGEPFFWNKGKTMFSYTDWERGYQFQLLAISQTEAKRVIEQVMDIRGFSPDWSRLNLIQNAEPDKAYPSRPKKKMILGKSVSEPQLRRVKKVVFQYALLSFGDLLDPICLVDRSNTFAEAIERV